MTETFGQFGTADDIRYYNQPFWLGGIQDIRGDGYIDTIGDELEVTEHTPPLMGVDVGTGEAWIRGNHYINDAAKALSIGTADAVNPRIDVIVARNYIIGPRTVVAMVIQGTPSPTPTPPSITRSSDVWDIVLAYVAVGAGVTSIVNANITDMRDNLALCGPSSPVAVQMQDIIILGDTLDMQGYLLDGVDLPGADNDGATLAYLKSVALEYPAGILFWWPAETLPDGYLECLGQSLLQADYPQLFAVMGTTFGGDATHFSLPDVRGRILFGYDVTQVEFDTMGETGGAKTHTITEAELPEHTHSITSVTPGTAPGGAATIGVTLSAQATGSAGGGLSHPNVQPYIVLKLIVRGA